MDEYNRLLSSQVATYTSEINRLKALVAKLQRMQFGKSSENFAQKSNGKYRKHRSESAHFRRKWQKHW